VAFRPIHFIGNFDANNMPAKLRWHIPFQTISMMILGESPIVSPAIILN